MESKPALRIGRSNVDRKNEDNNIPSTLTSSINAAFPKPCEHHVQQEICQTRAAYRQGKEFKAVKAYTINDESRHLILQDIPDLGLKEELKRLCRRFGAIQQFRPVSASEYPPKTPFTTVFYVQYVTLHQARYAKIKLDNRAFYGGLIHICYAPELESVTETRDKLQGRVRYVQNYQKKSLTRKRKHLV